MQRLLTFIYGIFWLIIGSILCPSKKELLENFNVYVVIYLILTLYSFIKGFKKMDKATE